jgi:hypothetical protein
MNFWLKGNVTIPARPHTVGGLIGWARGVNRALTELRDRKIEGKVAKGKGGTIKPLTIKQGTAANKFQIVPGFVNSLMPTLSGTALNNATPPEITVTADVWIYAKVVGTFGEPDTYVMTIHTASSVTPPSEAVSSTGFTSYNILGTVNFTAGAPDTFVISNFHSGGNLGVESFGAINLWWRK